MRFYIPVFTALLLAGCAAQVPSSPTGIGFNDPSDLQPAPSGQPVDGVTAGLGGEISDETVPSAVATSTAPPNAVATAPATPGPPPAAVAPVTPSPLPAAAATPTATLNSNNPGISDAQDFGAISARETIESAAEKLAAQAQAYRVIAPTALPSRPRNSGTSVVEFALATTNQVGQAIYQRNATSSTSRTQRNCAKYPSPDIAQQAFLDAGGPARDRRGLDPDGDGFACFWNPAPFRQALQN